MYVTVLQKVKSLSLKIGLSLFIIMGMSLFFKMGILTSIKISMSLFLKMGLSLSRKILISLFLKICVTVPSKLVCRFRLNCICMFLSLDIAMSLSLNIGMSLSLKNKHVIDPSIEHCKVCQGVWYLVRATSATDKTILMMIKTIYLCSKVKSILKDISL